MVFFMCRFIKVKPQFSLFEKEKCKLALGYFYVICEMFEYRDL